jgi:hypothetical protein
MEEVPVVPGLTGDRWQGHAHCPSRPRLNGSQRSPVKPGTTDLPPHPVAPAQAGAPLPSPRQKEHAGPRLRGDDGVFGSARFCECRLAERPSG